jgi:predicted site-specific integrase-resolvase
MPSTIGGITYHKTAEACEKAGISKNTFFRWLRSGQFEDVATADRHGWRLFSESDVERLCQKSQQISTKDLVPNS